MGLKDRLFSLYFPESIATSAIRRFPFSDGIVLMYHEVLPDEIDLPAWTIVRESDFYRQMSYLRKNFDVLNLDQALERVFEKTKAKRPFAVVTFDDGYRGNLHTVLPIMESLGLPFIVYLATQAIIDRSLHWYDQIISLLHIQEDLVLSFTLNGQKAENFNITFRCGEKRRWWQIERLLASLKRKKLNERQVAVDQITEKFTGMSSPIAMLSPQELQDLSRSSLVSVGAHTHRHELLDQLDSKEVEETLLTANRQIARMTGYLPKHFSYPNGNYNQQVLKQVIDAGYKTAVITRPGIWSKKNGLFEIPRLAIGRFETVGQFKARVAGYL